MDVQVTTCGRCGLTVLGPHMHEGACDPERVAAFEFAGRCCGYAIDEKIDNWAIRDLGRIA